jgi:hypothetical protein
MACAAFAEIVDLADETGGFFLEENTEGDPQRAIS